MADLMSSDGSVEFQRLREIRPKSKALGSPDSGNVVMNGFIFLKSSKKYYFWIIDVVTNEAYILNLKPSVVIPEVRRSLYTNIQDEVIEDNLGKIEEYILINDKYIIFRFHQFSGCFYLIVNWRDFDARILDLKCIDFDGPIGWPLNVIVDDNIYFKHIDNGYETINEYNIAENTLNTVIRQFYPGTRIYHNIGSDTYGRLFGTIYSREMLEVFDLSTGETLFTRGTYRTGTYTVISPEIVSVDNWLHFVGKNYDIKTELQEGLAFYRDNAIYKVSITRNGAKYIYNIDVLDLRPLGSRAKSARK